MTQLPLYNFQALNLAYNLPGPAAAARLQQFGAPVIKTVERELPLVAVS